jgi:hypothetical protein
LRSTNGMRTWASAITDCPVGPHRTTFAVVRVRIGRNARAEELAAQLVQRIGRSLLVTTELSAKPLARLRIVAEKTQPSHEQRDPNCGPELGAKAPSVLLRLCDQRAPELGRKADRRLGVVAGMHPNPR